MFLFFQCQLAVVWDIGWTTDIFAGEPLNEGCGVLGWVVEQTKESESK